MSNPLRTYRNDSSLQECTSGYRYGFGGQEKTDEMHGVGNTVNYSFRNYDARLGRFQSLDPISFFIEDISPYSFNENCVIACVEIEGLESSKRRRLVNKRKKERDGFKPAIGDFLRRIRGFFRMLNGEKHWHSSRLVKYGRSRTRTVNFSIFLPINGTQTVNLMPFLPINMDAEVIGFDIQSIGSNPRANVLPWNTPSWDVSVSGSNYSQIGVFGNGTLLFGTMLSTSSPPFLSANFGKSRTAIGTAARITAQSMLVMGGGIAGMAAKYLISEIVLEMLQPYRGMGGRLPFWANDPYQMHFNGDAFQSQTLSVRMHYNIKSSNNWFRRRWQNLLRK